MKEKMFPVLVGVLIVMAFVMGAMWSKLQTLGEQAPQANQADHVKPGKYKNFDEAIKDLAKQVKIDGSKLVSCINSGEKKGIVDADTNEGGTLGVTGTPAFFINGKFLGGAFPLESFKEIIDKELAGKGSTNYKDYSKSLQEAYEDPRGKAFDPVPKKVNVGNTSTRGTAGAKVIIVEYSDFQCPYCERAYPTVQQILKEYEGNVLVAYKHLPLVSIHQYAQKAAEAAECAKDQGKFWEFHDKLFETQSDWANL